MEELSDRKKQLLKAIIESYIESGEPVGSKYLVETRKIPFSSATIRNEMSELEELGYLEKPHTSAGRIPSETGYRFYVDSLVEHYDLTNREIGELKSKLKTRQTELGSILESAMKLASSMTNYPALAIRPNASGLSVNRFEIVFIDERSMLLVMILSDGNVQTRSIVSAKPLTSELCSSLASVLNQTVIHLTAEQLTLPLMMNLEKLLGDYESLASSIVKKIYEVIDVGNSGELKVDGVNRLLSYPEYCDFGKLKGMLEMFEAKNDLMNVMASGKNEGKEDDVHVLIGKENPLDTMENSTLIFKPVKSGGKTVGAIGIIGPTRMDYPRVMAMINELSESVSELMDSGHSLPEPETGKTEK